MTTKTATHFWRIAIPAALVIALVGSLVGVVSNSGYSNAWFAALRKPAFMPPAWMFGVVWTTLYALMGVALALVRVEPASPQRSAASGLFVAQLAVNFAWSPIFFGVRMVEVGLLVILMMFVLVALTAWRFGRIRPLAGWLLVPYLAWLCVATALTFEIGRLNPGADSAPLGLFGG